MYGLLAAASSSSVGSLSIKACSSGDWAFSINLRRRFLAIGMAIDAGIAKGAAGGKNDAPVAKVYECTVIY